MVKQRIVDGPFWREVKNERRTPKFVHDTNQDGYGISVIET
ncbi:MAG TPA: hypothetical protein VH251_02510 [Verrucomicrobiae bacterium]|jgi:hypothetical protein|nr:hypothetical protein [Verrucomicrobiae bacterium]